MSSVGIGNYIKGAEVTPNGSTTFTDIFGFSHNINVTTTDQWGAGGGLIWEYDFGNKSYLRVFGLFGFGATNFASDIGDGAVSAFENEVNEFEAAGPEQSRMLASWHKFR